MFWFVEGETKKGGVFCILELQTDSDECTPVKVFFFEGGSQLSPGLDFLENKSPVKMKIEYEEDYQTYVLRDRYLTTPASTSEIPYLFDPNIVVKPQQRAQLEKNNDKLSSFL